MDLFNICIKFYGFYKLDKNYRDFMSFLKKKLLIIQVYLWEFWPSSN